MQGTQVSHYSSLRLTTTGQWAKGNVLVLLFAMLVFVTGCQKHVVIVDVPVKPKFVPPGNIKEFDIHNFEGPVECASDLQKGLHARAANAGDLAPTIPGLPDLDGPLEVKGKVDTCSLRMGHGVLNATMLLWHGGKQLHHEMVKEETNRPGASSEEVRATLVDRVIKRFASIFVPGKKSEIREGRPRGASDPWWLAVKEKHWKLAIDMLTTRISGEPNDAPSWYNRGLAHEGNGEPRDAVADYKKAVELERDDLYQQALVRAEKALQDAMAIETAKKARE